MRGLYLYFLPLTSTRGIVCSVSYRWPNIMSSQSEVTPRNLHILRVNGIAQSFFTIKEAALKEMVRLHISGVEEPSVETVQARGNEGTFDRGVEVYLHDAPGYMQRARLAKEDVLLNPALLFRCLHMRMNTGSTTSESFALGTREIDDLVADVYTSDAGEGIHRPVRPDYRPPLRPISGRE